MTPLKFALRTLFKTPFVTAVAIVSLALGIGANAAIFSMFNQLLLRPLPVQDPRALVNVRSPGPKPGSNSCGSAGPCDAVFSYAMFRDLQRTQTPFTDIAAHVLFNANVASIRKSVATLDSNLPVERIRTLPEQIRENVFIDRFITTLSTAFAVLATLLAAAGLYGVLAYTVSQRTREIGLRMALGASPARVRGMVLKQVGVMIVIGGAIGLAAAVSLGRLAESLLYQLKGWDPTVLAASTSVLTIVALVAGFIPAHRASRIEPTRALRYE